MQAKLRQIPYYGALALLAYMPFHIFIVQWMSTFTGGLSVWKAAKDVIAVLVLLVTLGLVYAQRKSNNTFNLFFAIAVIYFGLHLLVWVLNPDIYRPTALLGIIYNNRLLGYLLLGMGAALLYRQKIQESKIIKLILVVSTIVCLLGLLQYFLPKDIMTHFGYSVARGVKPAFFIDDKPDLPRIMSTLRDPNSLGGYLVIPITLLVYKLFKAARRNRLLVLGLLGLHVLVLLLTFSRSALLAAILSVSALIVMMQYQWLLAMLKRYWTALLLGTVLLLGGLYLARDQYFVQNTIFHSDETTTAQLDSNDLHLDFAKSGINGMVNKPQGHGPGTAGIVSIQNPKGGLLTENYYIQIGYEIGVVGLGVLSTTLGVIYWRLKRFTASPLTLIILASFWGYAFMALLTHLWTNEAIAAQWWLLAGLAMAQSASARKVPAKP